MCRACAVEVAPCDGLIPEHIGSVFDARAARAWLIDGFGGTHAVGEKAMIGRHLECEIVILTSSVSREHAALALGEAGWTLRDLGSRNGTFVDDVRIEGEVPLAGRALIRLGDVALWFLTKTVETPTVRPEMATGGSTGERLVCYQLVYGATELRVIAGSDVTTGGALMWRHVGEEAWSERQLARLEFQLLRALCVRAHAEAGLQSPVRGCVQTKTLLRDLPFQSKYANHENVRQVVLRLRTALNEIGAGGLLSVAPGRGYYLACNITAGGVSAAAERR